MPEKNLVKDAYSPKERKRNKPCDEVLGAVQCKRLETRFMSTIVKLRKRLRYDLLLAVT